MEVLTINPRSCTRWHYADRSLFEFGDIAALSEDIKRNGQVEPVFVRVTGRNNFKYEIIAGSRRWKACLDADLPLKAILFDIPDEEAALIQIKENQSLGICDYSKGVYYAKLLTDHKMTQEKLAQNINCSRQKLQNFLSFSKIPQVIWDAVGNTAKVSSKTASVIYSLSQKGERYVNILIELSEEIKKGIGSTRLERIVNEILLGQNDEDGVIKLPSGIVIGTWKNNSVKLDKHLKIDRDKFIKHLAKFF